MFKVSPSPGLVGRVSHLISSTMTEQGAHSSVVQCIIIKFLATEGVKPAKILRTLRAQYVEQTLSKTQVFHWHKNIFLDGKLWKTNPTNTNQGQVSKKKTFGLFITLSIQIGVSEIVSAVGVSYGSVQAIISNNLNFRKVSARWVLNLLPRNKNVFIWMFVKASWLAIKEEGEDFLHRILTCDKT